MLAKVQVYPEYKQKKLIFSDLNKFEEQKKTRKAPIIARAKITDLSNKNK